MRQVATFVGATAERPLDDSLLAHVARHLPEAEPFGWLEPGVAADIAFISDADAAGFVAKLRAALAGWPIDVFVQPQAERRKKLLLADMDSTVIEQECIDELADYVGLKAAVARITDRAMRGEIAFEPALRERVALLRGLKIDTVERVLAERIGLTPGARTLVQTMRAHGAYTALVSGGFNVFACAIAAKIGFDAVRANDIIVEDGKLAGIVEPVLGTSAKLDTLRGLRDTLGLAPEDTLAVGDGANDIAMLKEAGLGVAYRAKPTVAAAAAARIDHGDLTALLYAQGYIRAEFQAAE
ncbi:MAG TPA: phosphoserine phosphatase SerB [Methylovirgula sp.]|jgi:phosphoserine phosphatase|nr:phosphoserine phosphatase SerB [Methylovirgula sp.]